MPSFSSKERFIASLLSSVPGLKRYAKRIYVTLNAIFYRKKYRYRILHESVSDIRFPFGNEWQESFFGYYDKSPDNNAGIVLAHIASHPTSKKPLAGNPVKIAVSAGPNDLRETVCTASYNWQQGSRTHWIDDESFIYNDFQDGRYKAFVYSTKRNEIVKSFDLPVQDSFGKEYFLSINYRRIMKVCPDYGYRNLPPLSCDDMNRLKDDGIWHIDYESGKSLLLHSLAEIVACEPKEDFAVCSHTVNHVMISPDGKRFIFIHRYYKNGRRYDRLMLSDFRRLTVLADDEMVSHCCWMDGIYVLGYLRHDGTDGFYYIDTNSGIVGACAAMTAVSMEDGHPSCCGEWVVFDTYPDKGRMQHLYLYNRKADFTIPLLEVYHGLKYMEESRCDLHPRFSCDGRKIYFDTVCDGKRKLAYIDVGNLMNL